MTKYLIVKCEELHDQYECDADREPMALVDDWEKWYWENHPNYSFEVYKFEDDKECTLEKTYEESVECGMALYFWNIDDNPEEVAPTMINRYAKYNRNSSIPKKVRSVFLQGAYWSDGDELTAQEFMDRLHQDGFVSWDNKEHTRYYVYGYYRDGIYSFGY